MCIFLTLWVQEDTSSSLRWTGTTTKRRTTSSQLADDLPFEEARFPGRGPLGRSTRRGWCDRTGTHKGCLSIAPQRLPLNLGVRIWDDMGDQVILVLSDDIQWVQSRWHWHPKMSFMRGSLQTTFCILLPIVPSTLKSLYYINVRGTTCRTMQLLITYSIDFMHCYGYKRWYVVHQTHHGCSMVKSVSRLHFLNMEFNRPRSHSHSLAGCSRQQVLTRPLTPHCHWTPQYHASRLVRGELLM